MAVTLSPIECCLVDSYQSPFPNHDAVKSVSGDTVTMTTSVEINPLKRFDLQWKSLPGKPVSAWCEVFWETRGRECVRVCGTWMDHKDRRTQTRSTYLHMDEGTEFTHRKGLVAPRGEGALGTLTLELRRANIYNKQCVTGDDRNGEDEVDLEMFDEDDRDTGKTPWMTVVFNVWSPSTSPQTTDSGSYATKDKGATQQHSGGQRVTRARASNSSSQMQQPATVNQSRPHQRQNSSDSDLYATVTPPPTKSSETPAQQPSGSSAATSKKRQHSAQSDDDDDDNDNYDGDAQIAELKRLLAEKQSKRRRLQRQNHIDALKAKIAKEDKLLEEAEAQRRKCLD